MTVCDGPFEAGSSFIPDEMKTVPLLLPQFPSLRKDCSNHSDTTCLQGTTKTSSVHRSESFN